jgi:hypothetical protein
VLRVIRVLRGQAVEPAIGAVALKLISPSDPGGKEGFGRKSAKPSAGWVIAAGALPVEAQISGLRCEAEQRP